VVIALVITPEGLPLAYEVLPGNTKDPASASAIGLLGDEAERNQSATTRWSPPTATAAGVPASMQSEDAVRETPGFSVGDPCATKSAQIYLRVL
jgi:hypothetical protein